MSVQWDSISTQREEHESDSFLPKEYKNSAQFIEFSHALDKNTCYLGAIYCLFHFNFEGSSNSVSAQ